MATKFTKLVTVNAPDKDVVFDGCDFTGEAHVELVAAKSVVFRNCRFYGLIPYQDKSYGINGQAAEMKLTIEKCFFGANPANDVGKLYNLLELNTILADGSSISNNYFAAECCTHNQINVYAVVEGATINLNKNHFVYSGNAYRIGVKNEPVCVINMDGNSYDTTDPSENGDWAGLALIQPYGKVTTSFNNMELKINNVVNKSGDDQIVYIYANPTDTQFDRNTNYPKVYLDGILVEELYAAGGTIVGPVETPIEPTEPGTTV